MTFVVGRPFVGRGKVFLDSWALLLADVGSVPVPLERGVLAAQTCHEGRGSSSPHHGAATSLPATGRWSNGSILNDGGRLPLHRRPRIDRSIPDPSPGGEQVMRGGVRVAKSMLWLRRSYRGRRSRLLGARTSNAMRDDSRLRLLFSTRRDPEFSRTLAWRNRRSTDSGKALSPALVPRCRRCKGSLPSGRVPLDRYLRFDAFVAFVEGAGRAMSFVARTLRSRGAIRLNGGIDRGCSNPAPCLDPAWHPKDRRRRCPAGEKSCDQLI